MRFVPIKTPDQLDLQGLHRVRERLVHNRTEVINQIRGFLLERGITFNRGPASLRKEMPSLLEDAEQNLTPSLRVLLDHLWREWKYLDSQIERIAGAIDNVADSDAACLRLRKIPGVGPLVSTATVAAIGNGAAFRRGRDLLPGWDWYRNNTRPEAKPSCWVSPSAATFICARCLCTGPGPCYCG